MDMLADPQPLADGLAALRAWLAREFSCPSIKLASRSAPRQQVSSPRRAGLSTACELLTADGLAEGQQQIDSGLRQEAYAARIGVNRNTLKPKIEAAEVYETIKKTVSLSEVDKRWRALATLHAASPWLWPLWAPRVLRDGWTIEDTALHVARAGRARQPPRWADAAGLSSDS